MVTAENKCRFTFHQAESCKQERSQGVMTPIEMNRCNIFHLHKKGWRCGECC